MERIAIAVAIALLPTGIDAAQAGGNDTISISGVGAVTFGMTLVQAMAAGTPLVPGWVPRSLRGCR